MTTEEQHNLGTNIVVGDFEFEIGFYHGDDGMDGDGDDGDEEPELVGLVGGACRRRGAGRGCELEGNAGVRAVRADSSRFW